MSHAKTTVSPAVLDLPTWLVVFFVAAIVATIVALMLWRR